MADLLLAAVIALVLGTGLTASAVYITMVATVVPLLKAAGVPTVAAHMFAFYYGVVSDITPPTALAAVAASGLARANPMSTMLQASRIGITAYLVPIAFVYQPELLMRGGIEAIVLATVTVSFGLVALAGALTGYMLAPLDPIRRFVMFVAAFLLIAPMQQLISDIVGLILIAVVLGPQLLRRGQPDSFVQPVSVAEPSGQHWRLPAFMQNWLNRRVQREEPASAEGVSEADVARAEQSVSSLIASLNDDRMTEEDAPIDSRCWGAWAVIAVVAVIMGYFGSRSFHATNPVLWLMVLMALAAVLTAGLSLTLRKFVAADTRAAQAA